MTAPAEMTPMPGCEVPTCPAKPGTDVLVSADGGRTVWCLDHADDSWLPEVRHGRCGGCVVCKRIGITWTADGQCLHERCRRAWVCGKPLEQPKGTVRHGAYGRRTRAAEN